MLVLQLVLVTLVLVLLELVLVLVWQVTVAVLTVLVASLETARGRTPTPHLTHRQTLAAAAAAVHRAAVSRRVVRRPQ